MIEDDGAVGTKDIIVLWEGTLYWCRYAALYEYKSEDGHFCEPQMMKI